MGEPPKKSFVLTDAPNPLPSPDQVCSSILGNLAIRLGMSMQGSEVNGQPSSVNFNKGTSGNSGNGRKKRPHQDFQSGGSGGNGSFGDKSNKPPALEPTSSTSPAINYLGLNPACPYFKA